MPRVTSHLSEIMTSRFWQVDYIDAHLSLSVLMTSCQSKERLMTDWDQRVQCSGYRHVVYRWKANERKVKLLLMGWRETHLIRTSGVSKFTRKSLQNDFLFQVFGKSSKSWGLCLSPWYFPWLSFMTVQFSFKLKIEQTKFVRKAY